MDSNKCGRYKTFREELPTKKFEFINERDSIHRIKLLHENANNQNKSSAADVDIVQKIEEPEEDVEPIEVIEKIANTGIFRDNVRRIDMVLVVEDNPLSAADSLKTDFLTNVIKTGIEVEIEPGVMSAHKNLLFIKIHAPDHVITEYGEIFGTTRYFTENHLDSMSTKFMEKDWIKIIRNNYSKPNGYSNFERSLIVYKILSHLPFGDQANHYGIGRLLRNNIILDAYALHDGPYFFIPEQTVVGSNARQILYYSWVGFQNVFKFQPLHLIHEYFGPTIAFYFAFYGYLNKALAIASIAGIITTVWPLCNGEENLRKLVCKDSREMCQQCEIKARCPLRISSEYCLSMTINILLDHPYTVFYSLFTVFWAFTFITFWKRKEYFLKWMWELNGVHLYYKSTSRPEFEINYRPLRKSFITGLIYKENGFQIIIRFLFTKGPILLYIYSFLAYIIVHLLENHSTYKAYEESLIMKEFGFSMISIFSYMGYIAWMVAGVRAYLTRCWFWFENQDPMMILNRVLSRWPKSPWINNMACHRYCWPFTCIIELSILLMVTLVVKFVVVRAVIYNKSLRIGCNGIRNTTVPCWEREYTLNKVDESFLSKRYHFLALQFSMATLFGLAFPLAPLLMLLLNICDLRYTASHLVLTCRRPLLIRKPGIGVWNKILTFIAVTAIITNALTLILTTRMTQRYFMEAENITVVETLDRFTSLLIHLLSSMWLGLPRPFEKFR
ncbi:anoctamin-5-like [Nymphalis io]|uniref:anoctamin-5-like n=1 Tax=Inachis io TaxID=171585 RepID=UPI002167E625|nr:anoctamin-5-like [Nymphalis io]